MVRSIRGLFIPALLVGLLTTALALAADKPNLLKPANKVDSWRFEQHEQAKGTIKADGDAILLECTAPDGEAWHVQAVQAGLPLKEGKEYVLSYKAKAEPARTISINAMIDKEDWHTIGLAEEVELTADWKDYSSTFKAEGVDGGGKNRISVIAGGDKGKVWLKDMTLTEK
jgi:Carbohydrate binding domain